MYICDREQEERKDYNLKLEKLKHLDVQANLPHSFNDNRCPFQRNQKYALPRKTQKVCKHFMQKNIIKLY